MWLKFYGKIKFETSKTLKVNVFISWLADMAWAPIRAKSSRRDKKFFTHSKEFLLILPNLYPLTFREKGAFKNFPQWWVELVLYCRQLKQKRPRLRTCPSVRARCKIKLVKPNFKRGLSKIFHNDEWSLFYTDDN